ncbi:MAG: class C sortase [Ruminococcus sp.]
MKKKKSNFITVLLVLIVLAGLSLLLYPTVSDYWNSFTQSKAIATYVEDVANLTEKKYNRILTEAKNYNSALPVGNNATELSDRQMKKYLKTLDVSGTGIMAYIEIPKINCTLPIYHGTEESVLQVAIGHIEWSSLPVGGVSTHCVLSGHRGLPSAKLFTNIDQLEDGDLFMIRVLDEVLTYQVDQIKITLPHETEELEIVEGKDYCTLVTCTPYGVNSHRLLVRGHRIDNIEESKTIHITADATQIEPLIVAPILAIPMLLLLMIILLFPKRKKKSTEVK